MEEISKISKINYWGKVSKIKFELAKHKSKTDGKFLKFPKLIFGENFLNFQIKYFEIKF